MRLLIVSPEGKDLLSQAEDGAFSVEEAAGAALRCEDYSGVPGRAAQRSAAAQADVLAKLIAKLSWNGALSESDVLDLLPGYRRAP